jgi:hypothetical protein
MLGLNTDQGGNAVSVARSTDGGLSWNQSDVLSAPPGCTFASGGCIPCGWLGGWVAGWLGGWVAGWRRCTRSWRQTGWRHNSCTPRLITLGLCPAGAVPVLLEQGSLFRGVEYW